MLKANGQKRVAEELVRRIPSLTQLSPSSERASGLQGHIWEQFYLPLKAGGDPLWSPSTSGPFLHRNHVVTMHDVAFIDVPQYFSKSFRRWYASMTTGLSKSARHIVSISDFTRKRIIEEFGIADSKVTTIHPGVTPTFHQRSRNEIDEVLTRYGIDERPYIIGFLGTDPRKNVVGLSAAWAQSGAARQGAQLVLFGRAANKSVFAASVLDQHQEGVVALGAVDDDALAALYSGARGFVFPSYYEGFGLPVVEAANCGCRIVTSNVTSLPEVSPTDAIFTAPSDTKAIAEAIRYLFTVADTDEAKAKRIAEMKRFNWDKAASQYSQLFAEVFSA